MKKAGKLTAILLALTIIISSFTGTAVFAAGTSSDFTIENGILTRYNGQGGAITIPDGVTSIDDGVFVGNTQLTSVTIPGSVTSIGICTFENCTGITSLTLSEGLTNLGVMAFIGCTGLTKISVPASVVKIGKDAFAQCDHLQSIEVNSSNPNYCSENGILFSKDKTVLIQYPAASTQTSYEIPSSVSELGGFAFSGSILQNITVPDTVSIIGENAFTKTPWIAGQKDEFVILGNHVLYLYNGSSTSVTIPDGVLSLSSAFINNTKLKSVIIPNSVTRIGDAAFGACTSLTSITIPNSVKDIGFLSFSFTGLSKITIPSSVTHIGYGAFLGGSLTSITIPDSVTQMDDYAFSLCLYLNGVALSKSLTTVNNCAFAGCASLNSIKIPDGVTSIGKNAFALSGLRSITIPRSVTSIDKEAFSDIKNLMICGYDDSAARTYADANKIKFSPLLVVNGKTYSGYIMFDTQSYNMAPGYLYDIGVKSVGNGSTKTIRVTSSQNGVATVKQLPNGNYRITGVSSGTTYITCTIYDGGREINHASIKVTIGRGMKRSGVSTRNKSCFD